ncbi:MAG: hypothetical protein ACFCBV_06940 [Phycisphaerales bacterium]
MRVARFWARAEAENDGWSQGAWGASDASMDEARSLAEGMAQKWAAEASAAHDNHCREYEYGRRAMPEPIVQDIHDQAGNRIAAVTINRYGARVLNTANLAFIDVDLEPQQREPGFLGKLFGKRPQASDGSQEAIDRLCDWVGQSEHHAARVYRTAAGLRYLLVSPAMQPTSDQTRDLKARLGAAPLYARLCHAQRSFRARLSPKPWRLGIRGTPKLTFEKLDNASDEISTWLRNYEDASRNHAVCELIDEIGTTRPPDDDTARLITIHDEMSGVGTNLPLA